MVCQSVLNHRYYIRPSWLRARPRAKLDSEWVASWYEVDSVVQNQPHHVLSVEVPSS